MKNDIEGFLSAFNYNAYGATNINDISSLVFTTDDQIPQKLAEKKRANPPPSEVNQGVNTAEVKEEDMHNKRVKDLFTMMETKVFEGKPKMYKIFKRFDKDCDGFVSYEDFETALDQLQVFANKQEVASMVKLIDSSNKGYLDFTDFSRVFRPDMSEHLVNVDRRDNYNVNLVPSKEITETLIEKQTKMQEAVKEIRKGF